MDSIGAAETLTSGLLPPEDIYSQSSDLQALAPNQNSPSEPELPNPNIPAAEPESHSPIDKQTLAPKEPNQTAPSQSTGEDETNGRRRRRSRWDSSADTDGDNRKKRISRWSNDEPKPVFQLPEFMKEYMQGMNPEIQPLQARLDEIHRILQSGSQLDDRPEGARSPSPEPVYDNLGIRINTREYRARERLNRERQEIIAQIMKRDPGYKPPADYKPPKLYKKLYIPMKEYPGYNFIGLIIGPRGNTQKRMEKETGAKIVIRGKGSIKEGRFGQKRDVKFDPAENEDLHVLVEADNQEALDAAAGMVEKLLRPVDEGLNEHKRQQLRELATLNGTIKDEELCRLCGETGHRQYACPSRMSTFKSDVKCSNCGDGGHPTSDCPVKEGGTGKQMEDAYWSFMAEVNGTNPESLTKQSMPLAIMGSNGSGSNPPWASNNNAGSTGSALHPGLGSSVAKIGKEIDDSNLYIGSLPPTFDDNELIRLFQPFGDIVTAKVVKDKITGACKGYGFVKYSDVAQANQAITNMNGYRLDGKVIAVRVAGKPPQPFIPPGPPATPFPAYRSPNQGFGGYPSQQMQSSGAPPGSYTGAPLPWGAPPPPPPPPYAAYPPPPPPGSSAYASFQGQPMPPYGVPPYPTMTQSPSPQNVPSGETQPSYSAASNNIYGMAQPYTTDSMGYASYYYVNPPPPPAVPQSSVEQQQSFSSAPWGANPPMPPPPPPPPVEQSQQTTYDAEGDYEKLMAELK